MRVHRLDGGRAVREAGYGGMSQRRCACQRWMVRRLGGLAAQPA